MRRLHHEHFFEARIRHRKLEVCRVTDLDLYQPTAFQIGLEEVVAEFAEEERLSLIHI